MAINQETETGGSLTSTERRHKPVVLENIDGPNPFVVVTDLLIEHGYPIRIVEAEAKNKERNPGIERGVEFQNVHDLHEVLGLHQSRDVQVLYLASVGLGQLDFTGSSYDASQIRWIKGSYWAKRAEKLKDKAKATAQKKANNFLKGRPPIFREGRYMRTLAEQVVSRFMESSTNQLPAQAVLT